MLPLRLRVSISLISVIFRVEHLLSNPLLSEFQLFALNTTLPTPFKPFILDFLLSDLLVAPPRGSDNRGSAVLGLHLCIWDGSVSTLSPVDTKRNCTKYDYRQQQAFLPLSLQETW